MFNTLRKTENKQLNHSGRSYIGETMQIEGDLRSSGSVDVAGLLNGNMFVADMIITESGSVRGSIEAESIEVNGHLEGKITADIVIIGKNAVIKGDIFFIERQESELKTYKEREGKHISLLENAEIHINKALDQLNNLQKQNLLLSNENRDLLKTLLKLKINRK